ncbi:hypothetical protein D9M71_562890 [compost metagenome]
MVVPSLLRVSRNCSWACCGFFAGPNGPARLAEALMPSSLVTLRVSCSSLSRTCQPTATRRSAEVFSSACCQLWSRLRLSTCCGRSCLSSAGISLGTMRYCQRGWPSSSNWPSASTVLARKPTTSRLTSTLRPSPLLSGSLVLAVKSCLPTLTISPTGRPMNFGDSKAPMSILRSLTK